MATVTVTPPAKLPLWKTVGQSYALWAKNLPELVLIAWLWLVLMAPLIAILTWRQIPQLSDLMEAARSGQRLPEQSPGMALLLQVINQVIMLPVVASIAVAWHRLLLRHEHVGTGTYLRFDGLVVSYAVLVLMIGLIPALPQYVGQTINLAGTLDGPAGIADSVTILVFSVASIVGLFVSARLSVVLPARALGRGDIRLSTCWRTTRGNTWRLFWGYMLCLLPLGLINAGLWYWLFSLDYARLSLTIIWTLMSMLGVLGGMVAVGFLSLAYRHFYERGAHSS